MALSLSPAVAVPTPASSHQADVHLGCKNASFGSHQELGNQQLWRRIGVAGLRPTAAAKCQRFTAVAAARARCVVGSTRYSNRSDGETLGLGLEKCALPVTKLKSSTSDTAYLQRFSLFAGQAHRLGEWQRRDHERLVVRSGAKSGSGRVQRADGAQTLDIPLLGELPLPDFSNFSESLSQVTPLKAVKWITIVAVALAAISTVAKLTVYNPDFWVYGSWLFVIWPWPAAIITGVWASIASVKQAKSGTKEGEQVLILAGALIWLILVPLAHVHGFVDGWPILLFSLYYFFFSISAIVRSRLYGSLSIPPEDKMWQSTPSPAIQIAFITAIVGGHWLAAFESPFLVHTWNWAWQSKLAAAVLALAVVVHWNAIYFLGKYSDRLVTPRAVVMFGPYRWVRHPMYASYTLLFAGYCLALRSYWSLLFNLISCFFYYDQRTKVEESKLVEAFGTTYTSYREKTRHKYLPWLY